MKKIVRFLSVALFLACSTSTGFSSAMTDKERLTNCYNDSISNPLEDNSAYYKPFLTQRNDEISSTITTWINSLVTTNATFLDSSIGVGSSGQPADLTRDAFIDALISYKDSQISDIINNSSYTFSYSLPLNNTTEEFSNFDANVTTQIYDIMKNYVDSLLSTNATLLDSSIGVGGSGQPADLTRDAFKDALDAQIQYGDYSMNDAECLENCYNNNNYKPFLSLRNDEILDTVTIWIQSLLSTNDTFLDSAIGVGGSGQPADLTRDAFMEALVANQDSYISTITSDEEYEFPYDLPQDNTTEEFSNFDNSVTTAIIDNMKDFVDSLLSTNDTFLDASIEVGDIEEPADLTRDAFKDALASIVNYGEYGDGQGGKGGGLDVYAGKGGGRGGHFGGGRGRGGRGGIYGGRGGRGGGGRGGY